MKGNNVKRILLGFLAACALLAPVFVRADIPVTTASGTISSQIPAPSLTLVGQSTCSVVLSGTWSGTVTFQGSSDNGATWNTVTAINSNGTATTNGTYGGAVAPYTTRFRANVTTYTSGTIGYFESCSAAVSKAVGAGSGTVTGITAGNQIVVTTPNPAAPTVAVTAGPSFTQTTVGNGGLTVNTTSNGQPFVISGPSGTVQLTLKDTSTPSPASAGGAILQTINTVQGSTLSQLLFGVGGATAGNYGGYIVFETKEDGSGTFLENLVADHNGHLAALHTTFAVLTTTPNPCTALTICGTVSLTFDKPFTSPSGAGITPFCFGPSFRDLTTPGTIWIGDIETASSTAVTFQYAPMTTVSASDSVNVEFSCWDSNY